jgi:hypothetical protein
MLCVLGILPEKFDYCFSGDQRGPIAVHTSLLQAGTALLFPLKKALQVNCYPTKTGHIMEPGVSLL